MKLFRKGNGFHSSLTFSSKKVKAILNSKIKQERSEIFKNSTDKNKKYEHKLYVNLKKYSNKINIDSLFSGAGGLDLGVEMAGISVKYGPKIAYKVINNLQSFDKYQNVSNIIYSNDLFKESNRTYDINFKRFNGSFIKDSRNIKKVISFPKCDLMLGGFPCPGFSVAGPRLVDDPRNFLYINYVRALTDARPAFFIGENVKGLVTMAKGKVLHQIAQDFSSAGYKVDAYLVNARDYKVPQSRERVFLVGTRNDIAKKYNFEYKAPDVTNGNGILGVDPFITLKDALSGLPKHPNDVFCGEQNDRGVKSGKTYSSIYMSRNRRRNWNQQSFTIQASGRQAPQYPGSAPMKHIGHNRWIFTGWHRRLSAREEARIQCFPDWFKFQRGLNQHLSSNSRLGKVYKQIGNAVPVYLAEHMARPIMKFILNHREILKD